MLEPSFATQPATEECQSTVVTSTLVAANGGIFQWSSPGTGLALIVDVASTSSYASSLPPDDLRLGRDLRGAVFVEYVIIFGLVGIVVTLMLVTLGPAVVENYSARRGTLYSHSP